MVSVLEPRENMRYMKLYYFCKQYVTELLKKLIIPIPIKRMGKNKTTKKKLQQQQQKNLVLITVR